MLTILLMTTQHNGNARPRYVLNYGGNRTENRHDIQIDQIVGFLNTGFKHSCVDWCY